MLRSAAGLAAAAAALDRLASLRAATVDQESWEATNLLTIAAALTDAAALREETRGSHWREDFPERDDARWAGHLDAVTDDGATTLRFAAGAGQRRTPARIEHRHEPSTVVRTAYADLSRDLVAELAGAGLDPRAVYEHVVLAFDEDLPDGGVDVTSAAMPAMGRAVADVVAREDGVVAGLAVAELAFRYALDEQVRVTDRVPDGSRVRPGDVVLTVEGPVQGVLTAERTALNFASHLSGVATATAAWVQALEGTGARVLDTRKTLPGWRSLQKYAVRCGGGVNHRFSLSDRAMVKDNHVVAAGGVVPAFRAVRAARPDLRVEVEVTDLDQLRRAAGRGLRGDPAGQHVERRRWPRRSRWSSGTGPPAG